MRKQMKQLVGAKNKLADPVDALDILDKLYDRFLDKEKKEFLSSFVERVDLYEKEQEDGRFLQHIKFRFPVFYDGIETEELCWDNESTVESGVLLSKR